jgi:hypothetical protein
MPCPACGGPAPLLDVVPAGAAGNATGSGIPIYGPCSAACSSLLADQRARAQAADRASSDAAIARKRASKADVDKNAQLLLAAGPVLFDAAPHKFEGRSHRWQYKPLIGRERVVQCRLDPAMPLGVIPWTFRGEGARLHFRTGLSPHGHLVILPTEGDDSSRCPVSALSSALSEKSCGFDHLSMRGFPEPPPSWTGPRIGDGIPSISSEYLVTPHVYGLDDALAFAAGVVHSTLSELQITLE